MKKPMTDDNESIASTDEELAEENQRYLYVTKYEFIICFNTLFLIFYRHEEYESEEEEEETAQEKRIRLAKKYLEQIEEEGESLLKYLLDILLYHILTLF